MPEFAGTEKFGFWGSLGPEDRGVVESAAGGPASLVTLPTNQGTERKVQPPS